MPPRQAASISRFCHLFLTLESPADFPRIHRIFFGEQQELRAYFGLRADPFPDETDPDCYRGSPQHQVLHDKLCHGLEDGISFGMVTARAGLGKGHLVRNLRHSLPSEFYKVLELKIEPGLTVVALLREILSGLGCDGICREQTSARNLWSHLPQAVCVFSAAGPIRLILLLDDAQYLTPELWQALKVISDIKTSRPLPITIMLFGDDALRDLLQHRDQTAIRQRTFLRERLRPMTSVETGQYLQHRLAQVHFEGRLFTPEASDAIFRATDGIHREINTIAANTLVRAFCAGKNIITADMLPEGLL